MDESDPRPTVQPTAQDRREFLVSARTRIKALVRELGQQIELRPECGRELAIARTELQSAAHWLGEAQLTEGFVTPYPN
jgi:hypothetical protein